MIKFLSPLAKEFLELKPVQIAIVNGYKFYEHPIHGDESPLICITPLGRKKITPFWDSPDLEDVTYWISVS